MAESIEDIQKELKQNGGKYVMFDESDKPKLVVFDAQQHRHLVAGGGKGAKKVLVTGGLGYIGSQTVADLLEHGYQVIVFDNLSTGRLGAVECSVVVGDLQDRALLDKVFENNNIDAVVHFAGSIIVEESVLDPAKYFGNNLAGSVNLLNAMVKHGVGKFVYSSTAAVYGAPLQVPISEDHPCAPTNPYGQSKLMVERLLEDYRQAYDLSSVIFRYFNASGASPERGLGESHPVETHLIPRILRVANKEDEILKIYGSDYPTPDGTAIRDYVHVKDLARAHVMALDKLEAETGIFKYNVGTGRGYSVGEIVDMVMEVTRKMVPIERAERRPGDPPQLVADVRRIKAELGFDPQHSELKEIISSAWLWHKGESLARNLAAIKRELRSEPA